MLVYLYVNSSGSETMRNFQKLRSAFYALEDLKEFMMLELVKLDDDQAKYKKASVYPLPDVEEMKLPVSTENGEQVFFIFRILFDGVLPPYFESTKENAHDAYRKLLRKRYETGTTSALRLKREVPHFEQAVVYIKHHFSDLGIRDLDNRNRKLLLDALRNNQIIGDDNWQQCAIYEEGVLSEKSFVEVFVLERDMLPHFLLKMQANVH